MLRTLRQFLLKALSKNVAGQTVEELGLNYDPISLPLEPQMFVVVERSSPRTGQCQQWEVRGLLP